MSAKITRPSLFGVVQRDRLFTLLDGSAATPVTWVSAPGGTGKSTLVASYLDARRLPCIWYNCDQGDVDLATFFYYMGLAAKKAAPRYKKPLPLLMPEYLAGVPTFTRRYFETLFSRCKTVVFDNYQDIPADAPFHGMIASGLDCVPQGVRILVISRSGPPPLLVRLLANGKITRLNQDDVRFNLNESRELAHGCIPALDWHFIRAMHEKTDGWAAGMILMLEWVKIDGKMIPAPVDQVFDYFAAEVFDKTDRDLQDFLLNTAFLPVLSSPLARLLSGDDSSGQKLSALYHHHLFTEKLSGSAQNYQYHPLFREFLLDRAKSTFTPEELAEKQTKAALLLEQAGFIEDAARLYCEAGDRDGISRMVIRHARELLMQGRSRTVEEWIACIPREKVETDPWLLYWSAMCSFFLDMPRSRTYFEKAFALFKAKKDPSGLYLTWAAIVDSYAFGDGWKNLDDCIEVFSEVNRSFPFFPSKEIELSVSSRMLLALTLRKTDEPNRVQDWLERVSALLQQNASLEIQIETVFCMSVYYLWKGEYGRNAVLLENALAEICHSTPSPFAIIRIKLMKGIHFWITAQYDLALKTLSEGLETSAQSGVHVYDSLLWCFRAAAEMAPGNLELAAASLKRQLSSLLTVKSELNTFFYYISKAWYALLTCDTIGAVEHMEAISVSTENMGVPYYQALWNIGMASALFEQGDPKKACLLTRAAHSISQNMKSPVMEWYSQLAEAYFLLKEGKVEKGLPLLRNGLSLGKRYGYVHLEFYQPKVMRYLFARALMEGIEPAYVTNLIKKLGLTPPTATEGFQQAWPWPVKIRTLGRFEIFIFDVALVFSGKEQKKPLELLKALIACGGRDVPRELLIDALWPDADGDLALKSFETTLGRLRRLLGCDGSLIYRARLLSINPIHCWVDTQALDLILDGIGSASNEQIASSNEKAIELYQGPFLPADTALPWSISCRETLKNRVLRCILNLGCHREQAKAWELAADCFTQGIEIDPLAEEFYRRLMVCQQRLGNHADAVRTYQRCRTLLWEGLAIKPSPETTAVYTAITQKA